MTSSHSFFLISTCDYPPHPSPPLPSAELNCWLPPSHSLASIPRGMAIFFFTSCLNVSLWQEQRVFLWSVHIPGVCSLVLLDKALFYQQPEHTERAICWDRPQSEETGEDPTKGAQSGEDNGAHPTGVWYFF